MKLAKYAKLQGIRYLVAGAWNLLFGYMLGVVVYLWLNQIVHVIIISIIVNIITITMSFLTYKIFVFKTSGGWLTEYLKIYAVYGSTAFFGTVLLWIFIDYLKIDIWFSQGLVLSILFIFSFILNKKFTFKGSSDQG